MQVVHILHERDDSARAEVVGLSSGEILVHLGAINCGLLFGLPFEQHAVLDRPVSHAARNYELASVDLAEDGVLPRVEHALFDRDQVPSFRLIQIEVLDGAEALEFRIVLHLLRKVAACDENLVANTSGAVRVACFIHWWERPELLLAEIECMGCRKGVAPALPSSENDAVVFDVRHLVLPDCLAATMAIITVQLMLLDRLLSLDETR